MSIQTKDRTHIIIRGVEEATEQSNIIQFAKDQFNLLLHLAQYRDLIYNLVVRELKVRYKDSVLGILWSLMNPFLMMIVFTIVFTVMAPVASVDNFPVFLLCGLLPWNFFTASLMGSTFSVVGNAGLIKKVYFPREVLPISIILANLVHFFIALFVLFGMIFVFRIRLTIWLLYLPLVILIHLIFTLGVSLFLAAANVFYRDTQQIMDVLMLAWFFFTPIFYPLDILPKNYNLFGINLDVWWLMYIINPMASLIANYRIILYHGSPPALDFLARTMVTALITFVIGWVVFNRYSWHFAEEL
ncbi:ABC transporter permease [Anaerolineales bacterium HSG24]|nr:ABC transporter permease [Anaerolineales bacterium HSG24]